MAQGRQARGLLKRGAWAAKLLQAIGVCSLCVWMGIWVHRAFGACACGSAGCFFCGGALPLPRAPHIKPGASRLAAPCQRAACAGTERAALLAGLPALRCLV
jgi:hypothetical protein